MADTHAKVANSFEDEESYHDDDLAGGDNEEGKNEEGRKDDRRGGRRFNNRRRRRRASNDEPTGPIEPIVLGVEVTKWSIRKKVWDSMEDHNLVNFPRPCHHRIPNFKGAALAADKLPTMDEFKHANIIKVNPDKPQEQARFLTLEGNKTLLVPTPRLRSGLFNRITPPEDPNKEVLRICSTSQGVREYSTPIGLDDKVKIDLVITGSVAVSRKGYRLGKGEGFADLEWAMMFTMGAVNENTVVVSTVHDHQIIDIPDQLIEEHDLTVDYIVTPTEIIKTDCKRSKAKGIIWSKLDKERLKRIPVLKKLRKMERAAGVDVRLRGQEEDNEEDDKTDEEEEVTINGDDQRQRRRRPRFQNYNRRFRRPRRTSQQEDEDGAGNSDSAGEHHEDGEVEESDEARNRKRRERRPRQSRRPRGGRSHDPSIYVGGLPRSLRVSEFKEKIHDRSVQPLRVVWHGGSGHAFLQFQYADVAEDAIEALKDLDINGRQLKVELARSNRGDKSGQDDEEGEGGHDVNEGD